MLQNATFRLVAAHFYLNFVLNNLIKSNQEYLEIKRTKNCIKIMPTENYNTLFEFNAIKPK